MWQYEYENDITRLLTAPKYIFHKSLELVRFAIMVELYMQWRRGEKFTYCQLLPPIVAIISLTKLMIYYHKHYLERELDTAYYLCNETKPQFKKQYVYDGLYLAIACHFVLYREIIPDRPNDVYYLFMILCIVVLLKMAFDVDRMLLRITIGNRIDIDKATIYQWI